MKHGKRFVNGNNLKKIALYAVEQFKNVHCLVLNPKERRRLDDGLDGLIE